MNLFSIVLSFFSKDGKSKWGNIISLILLLVTIVGSIYSAKKLSSLGIKYNNELAKNATLVQETGNLASKISYQMEQSELHKRAYDSLDAKTKKVIKQKDEKIFQLSNVTVTPGTVTIERETPLDDSSLVGKCSTSVNEYQKPYRATGYYKCGKLALTITGDPLNLKLINTYNKFGVSTAYAELDTLTGYKVTGLNVINVPPSGFFKNTSFILGLNPGLLSNSVGVLGGMEYKRNGFTTTFDYDSDEKAIEGKLYLTRRF